MGWGGVWHLKAQVKAEPRLREVGAQKWGWSWWVWSSCDRHMHVILISHRQMKISIVSLHGNFNFASSRRLN